MFDADTGTNRDAPTGLSEKEVSEARRAAYAAAASTGAALTWRSAVAGAWDADTGESVFTTTPAPLPEGVREDLIRTASRCVFIYRYILNESC